MKQPSESFIGTILGLSLVALMPGYMINSKEDLIFWIIVLPGSGAVIGTIVGIVRRRNAYHPDDRNPA
jgi:hypothetical protein